jgi:hypothetical protein
MPPSKPKATAPYPFVVEALASLQPEVRPLFSGCGIYIGDRLVLILRDREKSPQDNGVWLVLSDGTDPADKSLRRDFPPIRRIELLRTKISHWLLIPSDDERFEPLALHACDLILRRDPRFGRVPQSRR